MSPPCRRLSSQNFPMHFLSLACWCWRSSCNIHAIVLPGPTRAFSNVARASVWVYQTLMDFSMT